jgi:hypothetical protein
VPGSNAFANGMRWPRSDATSGMCSSRRGDQRRDPDRRQRPPIEQRRPGGRLAAAPPLPPEPRAAAQPQRAARERRDLQPHQTAQHQHDQQIDRQRGGDRRRQLPQRALAARDQRQHHGDRHQRQGRGGGLGEREHRPLMRQLGPRWQACRRQARRRACSLPPTG